MPSKRTHSGVLGELARISAALSANADDLTHLEGPRTRLATILTEAQQVAQEQAALTASKQEATRRLKGLLVEGQRMNTGIVRFLQEHYGNRSEKLAEFGLQPFRGRKPRTPKPTPEPGQPTAPTPPNAPSAADDPSNL
jgi:UDP-N-acetylmuramyl tripeptide synthase